MKHLNSNLNQIQLILLTLAMFVSSQIAIANTEHSDHNGHADTHADAEDHHSGAEHTDAEHDEDDHDETDHGQADDDEHDNHRENQDDHSGHDEAGHEEEGHIEVSAERASRAGIQVMPVGSATITESILLYGRTEPDPQQVSHVRARYVGLIRSIKPALGETVTAGEVIATIEGNDSLQRYTIRAPITGTVVQRHANAGEFAGDEPLLTIADYSKLWVALSVFPQEAERIRAGQTVRLQAGERRATSIISFINPGTGERPSIMARLPLENTQGQWNPGLLVEGEVVVAEYSAPLAVNNRALQIVEEETVVFVQTDDGFEVTPVKLGKRDGQHSEVLDGLKPGQSIAVQNSYLLKAELEKSGASHDH